MENNCRVIQKYVSNAEQRWIHFMMIHFMMLSKGIVHYIGVDTAKAGSKDIQIEFTYSDGKLVSVQRLTVS